MTAFRDAGHYSNEAITDMAKHEGAEHHKRAAEHHEKAAEHHEHAAKHHEEGDHKTAGHHAHLATGHGLHATVQAEEAAKQHVAEPGK